MMMVKVLLERVGGGESDQWQLSKDLTPFL